MGPAIATDADLIAASQRGDHAAFGQIVGRYQRVVCAVTYSQTRDQALSEDVAQDTFLAAWRQLGELRDGARLGAWLCGIARNLARKARRRSGRETTVEDPPAIAAGSTPFDDVCDDEAERVVGTALQRVPATYRETLVLYYRDGRSIGEVATVLGISEAAALQRLARGRRHLADGCAALVERSLSRARPRRDLVAGVLAALAIATAGSQVEASPHSHGGLMTKLGFTAAAAAIIGGGAAYLAHTSHAEGTHVNTTRPAAIATPAARPAAATARDRQAQAPALAATPTTPSAAATATSPDDCAAVGAAIVATVRRAAGTELGSAAAGLLLAGDGTAMAHQSEGICVSQVWPVAFRRCVIAADDQAAADACETYITDDMRAAIEGDVAEAQANEARPPTPPPVWTGNASDCPAVGAQLQALASWEMSAQPAAVALDAEAVGQLGTTFAETCAIYEWSDEVRHCTLTAPSIDAVAVCLGAV